MKKHSMAQVQRKFTPRSAAVLRYPVERADQLVTSEELLAEFWRGGLSADNAVRKVACYSRTPTHSKSILFICLKIERYNRSRGRHWLRGQCKLAALYESG